jgi:hypothetical protein
MNPVPTKKLKLSTAAATFSKYPPQLLSELLVQLLDKLAALNNNLHVQLTRFNSAYLGSLIQSHGLQTLLLKQDFFEDEHRAEQSVQSWIESTITDRNAAEVILKLSLPNAKPQSHLTNLVYEHSL